MMPWLPAEQVKPLLIPNVEIESTEKPRKSATKKSTTAAPAAAVKVFTIPNDGMTDIKKALEVNFDNLLSFLDYNDLN